MQARTIRAFVLAFAASTFFVSTVAHGQVFDVNQDGVPDVLLQEPAEPGATSQGHVRVISGATGAELSMHLAPAEDDLFGLGASAIRDLDGDGVPEVAAPAPGAHIHSDRVGRVYIYSGASGALLHELAGLSGDFMTWRLGTTPDFTGDGRREVVVQVLEMQADGTLMDAWRLFDGESGALIGKGDDPDLWWGRIPVDAPVVYAKKKPSGDLDGDGFIDATDLVLLLGQFGSSVEPGSDSATMPIISVMKMAAELSGASAEKCRSHFWFSCSASIVSRCPQRR